MFDYLCGIFFEAAFMADPQIKDGWRVTFLDASDPDHEHSIVVNEPGDNSNG